MAALSRSVSLPDSTRSRPAEATEVHTRILRCMLATDDSYAYWRHVDLAIPLVDRARVAFEQRWFGMKSEARVRTLIGDMALRFDAYPEALELLRDTSSIPARVRPFICHLHTQLADPLYRRFTGDWLPDRRAHGQTTADRPMVARWVEASEPGRWSGPTAIKFASNLLATALDVGLVGAGRDPRPILPPAPAPIVLGYALYLLRDTSLRGSLTENAYLRSLGVDATTFAAFAPSIPGIRYHALGGSSEVSFRDPSLLAWGKSAFREDAT